jgi:hypothetical protein
MGWNPPIQGVHVHTEDELERIEIPAPAPTDAASSKAVSAGRKAGSRLVMRRKMLAMKVNWKGIGIYSGSVLACVLLLVWILKLWRTDLSVPMSPLGKDTSFHAMIVKGLVENGWPLRNPLLGAPGVQELFDFPESSNLDLALMKLIALGSHDYATVLNLFYLATYPLTLVTSLYAFRQFGISYPSAVVGSFLYAFLPYHFLRGELHLTLASYYLVPFTVMMAAWFLHPKADSAPKAGLHGWPVSKVIASVVICLLIASTFLYYVYFSAFVILIAGLLALRLEDQQMGRARMALAACLLAVVFVAYLLNVSPSLLYIAQHGFNRVAATRWPSEAQIFGLKIATLLLPIAHHRLPLFAAIRRSYDAGAPLTNENGDASLGVVGAIGCLLLLANLIVATPKRGDKALFRNLASLNIACILLGTIGGLGSLASHVFLMIRSYNRISIYIGFLSLVAAMIMLDSVGTWVAGRFGRWWLVYPVLFIVLLAGVWDETSPSYVPDYAALRAEYTSDADFIKRIEESSPSHSMIFQLPYVGFPEGASPGRLQNYDLLQGYLHSRTLRWSFGAIKGRAVDNWQAIVVTKPVAELVKVLRAAGFSGIYVDRYGYVDGGQKEIASLSDALGSTPLVSRDGRLAYFPLSK